MVFLRATVTSFRVMSDLGNTLDDLSPQVLFDFELCALNNKLSYVTRKPEDI